MKINRTLALPPFPQPHSLYLIKAGAYIKAYITDAVGNPREIFDQDLVQAIVDQRITELVENGGASYIASTAISGHRGVFLNSSGQLAYANAADASHANKIIGISLNAASAGGTINVNWSGEVTEPSWNWTPGEIIYLGANGSLTNNPSGLAFVQRLGYATSATTIFLQIADAIITV